MKFLRTLLVLFLVVFVLPSAISGALWWVGDNPRSWQDADWSSARMLPEAAETNEAAVYVMSARTGGLKGAVSEHSWLVLKDAGPGAYERWDVVGWGDPVRRNRYDPDGRWYSNAPRIIAAVHGDEAEALIPQLREAIGRYRFSNRGDYTLFPGPNSNTFVASVLREVPSFRVMLPPAAVGRDFPADGSLATYDPDRREFRVSLFGYAGLVVGAEVGLEINIFGLVAGLDPFDWAIKVPAFGAYSLS